jgi:pseudouridine-5'-phosphate glycosidase
MGRNSLALPIAALLIASNIQSTLAQSATIPPGERVIAPEFQQMAIKRAEERKKLEACHREAEEQKILTRDKTKFLIGCVER